MKSKNPIIPACLVLSEESFIKRMEFASKVGNSVHIDVIDNDLVAGHCLNVESWPSFSLEYVEAHLMVRRPQLFLAKLKSRGVTRAIVHLESDFDLQELTSEARKLDILLGFAINPDTDLQAAKRVFDVSNYIQVMGVTPGKTGQAQQPQTSSAVSYFAAVNSPRLTITVDGGVNAQNIIKLKSMGTDYFIASSSLYDQGDWEENYQQLSDSVRDDD